jgi:L-ascorbate metabolism protein UlaG (beta-lactamase superfamily)
MNDGRSVFRMAVESGEVDVVDLLLTEVDDVSEKDHHYGMTPLHRASINGYTDITQRLVSRGADINVQDKAGKTSLYYAGKYGHRQIVDLLKANGGTSDEKEENYNYSPLLGKTLDGGEAIVWYLGHSGWAIKTKNKLLIFDYYEYNKNPDDPLLSNGRINSSEIKDQDVFVFVSHGHEDHFDDVILTWDTQLNRIHYIFGWKVSNDEKYVMMDGERELIKINGIEIVRISSELENESAFLVRVDGLTIYHGGDYYFREKDGGNIVYLAETYGDVDVAFIESGFTHICNSTIEKLQPRAVFPMHARNNERAYKQYVDTEAHNFPNTRFVCAENRGDRFHYRNGEVR